MKSLQDPGKKMSKSDPNSNATLFLEDSDDVIVRKVKRAVTDSLGSPLHFDPERRPGVSNLVS